MFTVTSVSCKTTHFSVEASLSDDHVYIGCPVGFLAFFCLRDGGPLENFVFLAGSLLMMLILVVRFLEWKITIRFAQSHAVEAVL